MDGFTSHKDRPKAGLTLGLMAATVAATLGSSALVAMAGPIAGVSNVQDLINLNQGDFNDGVPQGGITLSGIRYYDFQYDQTGTTSMPTAAQVSVQTAPSPVGETGLEFEFNWVAVAGSNTVSTIRYKIRAGNPPGPINRVGLFFNGDVPAGFAGAGTFAQVTETVRALDGTVLGTLGAFDDDNGPGVDVQQANLTLNPARFDLALSKAIRVNSAANGLATISIVDNTFRGSVIPEPTTLAAGLGVAGLLASRRRR